MDYSTIKSNVLQKAELDFWEKLKKNGEETDLKYARDLPDNTPKFILEMLSEFENEVAEFCLGDASGSVLDAGCGNGNILMKSLGSGNISIGQPAQKMRRYTGLDFSRNMLGRAAIRAQHLPNSFFLQGSVNHLPFKDKSFDRVVSSGVLTCLPIVQEAEAALSEFNRVLKPEGTLVVDFFNRASHFTILRKHILRECISPPEYVSPGEFMTYLTHTGFEVLDCRGFDFKPYQGYLFMSRWRKIIDPCFIQERFTRIIEAKMVPKMPALCMLGYRIYVKCRKTEKGPRALR
ncbi:MAG: class I SAM-dependent methyltransferase [Methanotrichaceae archaeon]